MFDGNAQSFRLVTRLEYNLNHGGMRLTYPVIAAMIKYPWNSYRAQEISKEKFSCFSDDYASLENIFSTLGLYVNGDLVRHPLSYILEAADDICYKLLDIEDAYENGIISSYEITEFITPIVSRFENLKELKNTILFESKLGHDLDFKFAYQKRLEYFRSILISILVENISVAFIEHEEEIMSGCFEGSLINYSEVNDIINSITKFLNSFVYSSEAYSKVAIGASNVVFIILDTFCSAAIRKLTGEGLTDKDRQVMNLLKIHGLCLDKCGRSLFHMFHSILDFITGMTDIQATNFAKTLHGQIGNIHTDT